MTPYLHSIGWAMLAFWLFAFALVTMNRAFRQVTTESDVIAALCMALAAFLITLP